MSAKTLDKLLDNENKRAVFFPYTLSLKMIAMAFCSSILIFSFMRFVSIVLVYRIAATTK